MKFLVTALVACVFYCNGEEATVKEVTPKDAVEKDRAATDAVPTYTNATNTDTMNAVAENSTTTNATGLDNAATDFVATSAVPTANVTGDSIPEAAALDTNSKNNVSTDGAPNATIGSAVLDAAPSVADIANATDSAPTDSGSIPADGGANNDTDPITNSTNRDQTKGVEFTNISYTSSAADVRTDDLKVEGLTITSFASETVQDGDVVQESDGGIIASYDDGNITVTKFGDMQ